MNERLTRRQFLEKSYAGAVGFALAAGGITACAGQAGSPEQLAISGGTPVRSQGWPEWPVWNPETDEERVIDVLRSGVWSRSKTVTEFEKQWAETVGARQCLATTNGTHALIVALAMQGIGAGDEVITTPYTFIATIDAIIQNNAMPVFADVEPETFQIDPDKIEEKITPRTKAILPVHILGLPADMERIMAIAQKHDLVVVEDACQAWLAEINHQKVGTFGNAGCFSFQNSKHLPIGEGGAIVSDDEAFMDRVRSYHNFGRPYGTVGQGAHGQYVMVGTKCRMTEYQAAIGLAQLKRLEAQTEKRNQNADYLHSLLEEIPGILPHKLYDNATRAAYHLFPFRYQQEEFQELSRADFLKALRAEGIPCSGGYTPLNTMPYLRDMLASRVFQAVYPREMLDFDRYVEANRCPANDQLTQEAVWFSQNMLLAEQRDMDDIAEAIRKVQSNAASIA